MFRLTQAFIRALWAVYLIKPSTEFAMASQASFDGEFCIDEDFAATCLKNEVIMVKEAIFGRLEIGRCLQDVNEEMLARNRNDPKFFNCYTNVIAIMDDICSGKQSCKVNVIKDIFQVIEKPCHASLTGYLKASYSCITAISADRACTVSVTSSAQHLLTSHSSSTKLSCGSRHQPWKLEAPAGQQINVSLLDFGGPMNQHEGDCLQYGYIIDRVTNKNISICGLGSERQRAVYNSQSNILDVFIIDDKEKTRQVQKIFIGVRATGCTDVVPPEDMWLRRRNQEAVVGCYSSRQTWHLNCVNNKWLGVIGNCTRESISMTQVEITEAESVIDNEVIAILVITFLGLILCTTIVVCGIVCLKRYNATLNIHKYENSLDGKHLTAPACGNLLLMPHST